MEPWYRQNLLIFVKELALLPELERYQTSHPLHIVHPDAFKIFAPREPHVIFYKDAANEWYAERIPLTDVRG